MSGQPVPSHGPQPRLIQQALEVTRDNIRSLGPAGALDGVWIPGVQPFAPYRNWLALVEDAITEQRDGPSAAHSAYEGGEGAAFPSDAGEPEQGGGDAAAVPALPSIPCWMDYDARSKEVAQLEGTIDILQAHLRTTLGYLLNAKFDLEMGTPTATAMATLEGGIQFCRNLLLIYGKSAVEAAKAGPASEQVSA